MGNTSSGSPKMTKQPWRTIFEKNAQRFDVFEKDPGEDYALGGSPPAPIGAFERVEAAVEHLDVEIPLSQLYPNY